MTVITRFAPSPTGKLHVGNIRTALHNWLWARKKGGRFILRLDDTDRERSTIPFALSIMDDLNWLGLNYDAIYRQSERFALYEAAFEQLRADGRVYPCYESQQELDLKRKILAGRGLPPVYDRAALHMSEAERAKRESDGTRPHWRFKLDHDRPIEWVDKIRGPQRFETAHISDPVIRREDGSWLYMLPSAVDDADMGVSLVVRGEDHVSNTALQIQMFQAMRKDIPDFAHEALLVGSEGKLSKRLGSLGCDSFREAEIEPISLLALLARIGTSDAVEPINNVVPLINSLDFSHFSRAPARFDMEELELLNSKIVRQLAYADVKDRIPASIDRDGWVAIQPNLTKVSEARDWWRIVEGPVNATFDDPEDRNFLLSAQAVAISMDWHGLVWQTLVDMLKRQTERSGKRLFLPLRQALTGMDHGPEMAVLLPLIGKDKAVERLGKAAGK